MVIIFMGTVMFVVGLICKRLHDDYNEYPNLFMGYKLKYAMKDKETWEEANNYVYKPCLVDFIFSVIFTLILEIIDLEISNLGYILAVVLVFFGPIICTEIHIRRFNKKRDSLY
ncbi:SdpI family protein [Clostridium perfringens]|nr:SdpI family protein [Clostridium perfringens]